MSDQRLLSVIKGPHLTEKSSGTSGEIAQYVFKIVNNATKQEVKNAIEKIFNVKVCSVRTVNMSGKTVRAGRSFGKRKNWKKAYVSLAAGNQIDLASV